jgi:hypothetical protein
MKYRNMIDDSAVEINGTEYIRLDDIKPLLTEIEGRVNDILDWLHGITGLAEIDEIYNLSNELSGDLY